MTAPASPLRTVPYSSYVKYAKQVASLPPNKRRRFPSAFLQMHAQMYDGHTAQMRPLVLEPWQVYAVDDPAGQAIYLKPRQVGFSFLRAARGLANSLLRKNYIAAFVSYNRDEAKNKIIYMRQLYESMEYPGKPKLIRDNAAELGWDNGSRAISLPAKAVRGLPNPDVFFDEWAFIAKAAEIYSGTLSSGVRGLGAFAGGSTPYGESNHFFEVWSNHLGAYPGFMRHRIEWWYSPAMCVNVPDALLEAPLLPTAERVRKFGTKKLKEIFAGLTLNDFQREHECSFSARDDTVISRELLLRACEWPETDNGEPDLANPENYCWVANYRNPSAADMDNSVLPGLAEAIRSMHPQSVFAVGYDVGRSGDGAQLVLVEERRDGEKRTRAFVRFHDTEFNLQEGLLISLARDPRHRKTHIDSTQIGWQMTENVRRETGNGRLPMEEGTVVGVNFSSEHQRTQVFTSVKQAVESQGVIIYPHEDLFKHFSAFKRDPEASAFQDRFVLNRGRNADGSQHHAEIVVALGLALYEYGRQMRRYTPDVRPETANSAPKGAMRKKPLWSPAVPGGFIRARSGLYVPGGA